MQHLVSQLESLMESRLIIGNAEQILVWNDDQRVDIFLKLSDAGIRHAHTAGPFELEWTGHNSDRQNALLFRRTCNHWGRPRPRATAHTGRNEDHIGISQMIENLALALFSSSHANLRRCPCTQALGGIQTDLNAALCLRAGQSLRIGVCNHKLHTL